MAKCPNVLIEPSPIYEGTEHGLTLVRHQGVWRRVLAVCDQPQECRIFLEVARIRQYRNDIEDMNVCEIVGRSVLMSNNADFLPGILDDNSLHIIPLRKCGQISGLRWTTVAYRRPKSGKQYQRLPETILVASRPRAELPSRLCCSRSMLQGTCYASALDTFIVPLYAALHGQSCAKITTTWKPCPTRQCSSTLEACIRLDLDGFGVKLRTCSQGQFCARGEISSIRGLTDGNLHNWGERDAERRTNSRSHQARIDCERDAVVLSIGKSQIHQQSEMQQPVVAEDPTSQGFQGKAEATNHNQRDMNARWNPTSPVQCADDPPWTPSCRQHAEVSVHPVVDSPALALDGFHPSRTVGLQHLPQELVFMILDHLPESATPTSMFYSTPKPANTLSQTCRYLRYCWLHYRPLHIYVHKWPWMPKTVLDLTPLQLNLLRAAARIIIDFAYVKFWRLKETHPVASQLADIFPHSEQLQTIEFLVPPAYDHLPTLNRVLDVDAMLEPILLKVDSNKVRWNPRCFLGSSHHGDLLLHSAVVLGDYSRTKAVLPHVHSDVNKRGLFVPVPLIVATTESNVELVELLLTAEDIEVDVKHCGMTPLHHAVLDNHEELVRILIKSGKADIDRRIGPVTMYEHAKRHCKSSIILLIESVMDLHNARDVSRI